MKLKQNSEKLAVFYYLLTMFILLSLATVIGKIFSIIGFPETNIVIVYLLAVLLTARFSNGYIYGMLASVISIFAYNYFFTEPYFTFAVNNPSYFVTFIIMMITSLLTSTLTSHAKKSAIEARKKEAETKALYMLTNHLTNAVDMNNIASIATDIISITMDCKAECICFDENKFQKKQTKEEYVIKEEFYDWLIYVRDEVLGTIRIPLKMAVEMTEAQKHLLRVMIESIALAMDRVISVQQRIKFSEETMQERYRGNLLRAISHDLRTPLSGIMGTSEMLMDMTNIKDPRYGLAEQIHNDAKWLHSLVENILSLTKLQDGKLILKKNLEAVEEVVGGAVHHIIQHFPQREIAINIPDELLLVPMDAKLIEQVLINLLGNAIKHTDLNDEIIITVKKDKENIVFIVADDGEGIAEEDLPNLFQMFYTSHRKRADAQNGIGLGLAICDAIVKAHGGSIMAHNNTDAKGAEFIFTLPIGVDENE